MKVEKTAGRKCMPEVFKKYQPKLPVESVKSLETVFRWKIPWNLGASGFPNRTFSYKLLQGSEAVFFEFFQEVSLIPSMMCNKCGPWDENYKEVGYWRLLCGCFERIKSIIAV